MDRRRFVTSAALGSAAAGAAVVALPRPAIAQNSGVIEWRLASSFPKNLGTLHGGVEYLCARVAALTDNRFQIEPTGPGELAPPLAVLDAVQAGTVEIGFTDPSWYIAREPAFGFAGAVPFGLTSRQQMAWLRQRGGLELINEVLKVQGCLGLPAGNTGAQLGGWFRKEIKSPEDFRGLKIAMAGLAGAVVARMGGSPQLLAGADIAPALEKGTVTAAAWTGPYDDEKLGLPKLARICHMPGWWAGNATLWAFVNQDKWRELPATCKAALEAACYETCGWVQGKYDAENPAALRRLAAAGAQFRPFPPDILQAANRATADLCADLTGKSPLFRKIFEPWKVFRDEQVAWSRTADDRFASAIQALAVPAKK